MEVHAESEAKGAMTSLLPPAVLFAGPINSMQAPQATIDGAKRHFFTCTGDGAQPPKCLDLISLSDGGRMLPGFLRRAGLDEASVGDVYLGAFSAGGQIWKRLLSNDQDRARVTGVMLHDAAYELGTEADPKYTEGYVRFGLDALSDPKKFMLMTASKSPNFSYQSGAATLRATVAEIERRSGQKLDTSATLPAGLPSPAKLWTKGRNIWLAQYDDIGHGGLAGNAGLFWQNLLQPWHSSPRVPSLFPGTGYLDVVAVLGVLGIGVAVGYLGAQSFEQKRG